MCRISHPFMIVAIVVGIANCDPIIYNTTVAATNIESTIGTPAILVDPTLTTSQNTTDGQYEVSVRNLINFTVLLLVFIILLFLLLIVFPFHLKYNEQKIKKRIEFSLCVFQKHFQFPISCFVSFFFCVCLLRPF